MLMDLVSRCIKQNRKGGYILLMPQYRPDIGRSLAQYFELNFYDYRQEVMLPLGWDAARIPLNELDDCLFQEALEKPLLAFNVEALITTKSEKLRRQWLYEFIHKPWPNKILLPLAIHQSDAPDFSTNVCDLQEIPLPEQNLINRLAL
ncbi:MAG TPA: hypothetical protein EYH06_06335 [Chromatiales bacterium]|nr:hypothetical protein [Thiotrichales bacterium]HIP68198.1 hypothetical protein [Chromatiales bacterium]